MSDVIHRVKVEGEWRDLTQEDIKNFLEHGMGRIENVRFIRSPDSDVAQKPSSRGKGKKRKQWELR